MAVELYSKNIYKTGDFKVAVLIDELPGILFAVKGIVNAGHALRDFKEKGIGTQDYNPLSNDRPVDVEIDKGIDGKAHVRFTHAKPEGLTDVKNIAGILGIDLENRAKTGGEYDVHLRAPTALTGIDTDPWIWRKNWPIGYVKRP